MIRPTATNHKALRSPWLVVSWLLGFGALFTGVAVMTIVPSDWADVAMGAIVFFLPGAWVTFRVPFMRVTLTASGLTNHGFFRNQTLAWSNVVRVEVIDVDDRVVVIAYAPMLALRGHHDGSCTLMQLAGYSTEKRVGRSRMTRQAKLIEQWLSELDHAPV